MKHQHNGFTCLGGNDVITQKISDHHPIVHDGVFFWNMMMQGNTRSGGLSFNNGFGLIESDKEYVNRLLLVARVIAEAVYRDPSIEVISLCEGPIKPEHVEILFFALMRFPFMARFMRKELFYKPTAQGQNWGLLMLADVSHQVTSVGYDSLEAHPKLANRFQLWKLEKDNTEKFIALAHFPFAGDEHKTDKARLSLPGQAYCNLIDSLMENYRNNSLIFCADFNFNPYLISQLQNRALDTIPHNNSILLTMEEASGRQVNTVTVDGILLSSREKQKYYSSREEPGLFRQLTAEYRFFRSHMRQIFQELMQKELTIELNPI